MSSSASLESDDLGMIDSLSQDTWKVFKCLTGAPEELRDLQDAVLSAFGALRLVLEYTQTAQLPSTHAATLRDNLNRLKTVLTTVENDLENYRQQRVSLGDVAKNARNVVIQGARFSSFYETLKRDPQTRMIETVARTRQVSQSDHSPLDWNALANALTQSGISKTAVDEDYFIIQSISPQQANGNRTPYAESSRSTVPESGSSSSLNVAAEAHQHDRIERQSEFSSSAAARLPLQLSRPEEEELPGYEPGTKPTTTAEKVHNHEQTTAILNAEAAIGNAGGSSAANPPAYTFDEGNSTEMDEDFARYIQKATANELKRRYQARQVHPKQGPFVYSWLPSALQRSFAGRDEIVSLLDANTFTVMAYETAPRMMQELDTLAAAIRLSVDGTGDDTVFTNATNTIKVMEKALSKFSAAQHPNRDGEFSDIDALDYEYDTARAVHGQLTFPSRHFDLAQKNLYNLLTYTMGMVDLLKDVFSWQTLEQRSREDLAHIWEDRRISARTAWIQKQLAGWSSVDEALLACRDWQSLRSVRGQAIAALQAWQASVGILHSNQPADHILLHIISASNLSKSRTYQCEVVLYAAPIPGMRPSWEYRHFQELTMVTQKSQQPIFNQAFDITLPDRPKMLDIMLSEVGLRGKEIGRIRLKFSDIPGVEKSLDGRDLLYGFDEELSLPIRVAESAKGKEVEAPTLQFRLAWKGRYTFIENAGLPTSPPGKMFRSERSHIPAPFPGQAELAAVPGLLQSVIH